LADRVLLKRRSGWPLNFEDSVYQALQGLFRCLVFSGLPIKNRFSDRFLPPIDYWAVVRPSHKWQQCRAHLVSLPHCKLGVQ
jgi:hypothetical protein